MNATIDDKRWRLRFQHATAHKAIPTVNLDEPLAYRIVGAVTTCYVERFDASVEPHWSIITEGKSTMGRGEVQRPSKKNPDATGIGYQKEQARQFALARALHDLPKPVAGALVSAYLKSGDREICDDLVKRGFKTLYKAVWNGLPRRDDAPATNC